MKIVSSQSKTHQEHGFEHGKQQKEIIVTYLKKWEEKILTPKNLTLTQYAKFLKEKKLFIDSILNHCPELLDEVDGIAKGAGIENQIAFCWQLLDEHIWVLNKYFNDKSSNEINGCSTLASKNPYLIFGQNLDIPKYKDGSQTILQQTFSDKSYLNKTIFTQAGALASFGVNENGLSVGVNALAQLAVQEDGLPVAFVIRHLLNSKTQQEANHKIQNIPHATGHHYLICDNNDFTSWECSANKVLKLNDDFSPKTAHTNHPIKTDDLQPIVPPINPANTSHARLQLINECLEKTMLNKLDQTKTILSTEPVSVIGRHEGITFFSAVFYYTQKFPTIYYQATPHNVTAYQKLTSSN